MEQKSFQTLYALEAEVEFILSEGIIALEEKLAGYLGEKHCVAVSDAAGGIALALSASGVGPGERVFCAAIGCAIPVQGVLLAGASPVFVDINPNTYTVDPYCVEHALRKLRLSGETAPKALIATDLFGAPCGYKELQQVCDRQGLTLIEDMSGAFGASLDGIPAGRFGRFSVASFASPCPLEEPGGGAVFCRGERDALILRSLRRTGRQQTLPGETMIPNMNSTDAALIDAGLEDCERQLELRRKVAEAYREALEGKVRTQRLHDGAASVYSQMVVSLPYPGERDRIIKRLREMNVPASAPVCGMQAGHSDWNRVMLVNALSISERLLSLPIHPFLGAHLARQISGCLLEAL